MFYLKKHGWNFIHRNSSFSVQRGALVDDHILLIVRSPFFMSLNNAPIKEYDKNCIVLIRPNTPHYYGPLGEDPFVNDWIWFSTDESIPIQSNTVYEGFNSHDIGILSRTVSDIVSEKREGRHHSEEIIATQLKYLLLKIDQFASDEKRPLPDNSHYSEMLYSRNRILSSFQKDISINDFAAEVHLSSSFFRHLYKEFFGISPQADLINTRLQYAQYLLKSTTESVSRIAEECGYTNHEHFMRQFKKYVGMTPSLYRVNTEHK